MAPSSDIVTNGRKHDLILRTADITTRSIKAYGDINFVIDPETILRACF